MEKLSEATKLKKFELYRDEPDMSKPGRFWISVAYELPKPEVSDFDPNELVYLALGASSIGVLSPRTRETYTTILKSLGREGVEDIDLEEGEVLKLWRSDKHWSPKINSMERLLKSRTKGSRAWKRAMTRRQGMYKISSRQNTQDVREIVSYLLSMHGKHFVVTDYVVRSKEGKLADSSKKERGGKLGLNWMAQNTGSLGRLVLWLLEKVKEHGGSVRRHKLVFKNGPDEKGANNKLWMAKKLREDFHREVMVA